MSSHLAGSMGRLTRSRYDLRVANLGPATHLSERLRATKVRVYDLGIDGPFALLRRVLALRKLIRQLGIDVVHSYGRAAAAARLAAAGVPLVSTLPNPYGNRRGWWGRVEALLERGTMTRCARLIAPSDAVRRHYAERWGVTIEMLPSFLDVPGFRERVRTAGRSQVRTRLGVSPEDFVLLHVGRGHEGDGLDMLMRAFHVARIEHPPLRLFLTGEESEIAPARAVAQSLDLGDAVVFLGLVQDVAPLYEAAEVFVLPSCREGWSMALLEAMTAGLPAVIPFGGELPRPATGSTAVLVQDRRPEAFARGILELTTSPERRAELGTAAAARAMEMDASVWAPQLEQVYADVVRASAG